VKATLVVTLCGCILPRPATISSPCITMLRCRSAEASDKDVAKSNAAFPKFEPLLVDLYRSKPR